MPFGDNMKKRMQTLLGIMSVATAFAAAVFMGQTRPAASPSASLAASGPANPQEILKRLGNRNVGVHDPSTIVKCKDEFWVLTPAIRRPGTPRTWSTGPPDPRPLPSRCPGFARP